jgi:NhaP-type Na+/H+ or K+/H+ antiporter
MEDSESSLDPNAWKRLRAVRVNLWLGAMKGLGVGLLTGYAGHYLAKRYSKSLQLTRNSLVLTMFVSGATCSYLGAVVYGKNSFSEITDIFLGLPKVVPKNHDLKEETASYSEVLRENDRNLVASFETSYIRRAEAIKKAKEQQRSNGK